MKHGGMSADEALKLVTIYPAQQLRIDNKVGSLEAGKDADFVVWSGNPLSNYARVNQTWIEGRKYFDRAEDAEAQKIFAAQREALVQKALGERVKDLGKKKDDDTKDKKVADDPAPEPPGHEHHRHHSLYGKGATYSCSGH
jgi:adenine deaminase